MGSRKVWTSLFRGVQAVLYTSDASAPEEKVDASALVVGHYLYGRGGRMSPETFRYLFEELPRYEYQASWSSQMFGTGQFKTRIRFLYPTTRKEN